MKIDVTENGKLWLRDQNCASDAVWKRIRMRACSGSRIGISPHAVAPPTPPRPTPLEVASQNLLVFATVTDDACRQAAQLPRRWRFAITADPAYRISGEQLAILRAGGHTIDAWGVQTEISLRDIEAFRVALNLDRCVLQAENGAQYESVPDGFGCFANPNDWTPGQRAEAGERVLSGRLAVVAEVYNGRPDTYSSQGVPVCSFLLGVQQDEGTPYYPLSDLLSLCPPGARNTFGVWHAAALRASDWLVLRQS